MAFIANYRLGSFLVEIAHNNAIPDQGTLHPDS